MLPPSTSPSATGSTGWRRPVRAKNQSIHADRDRGDRDHDRRPAREEAERDPGVLRRGGARTGRRGRPSPRPRASGRRPASSPGRRRTQHRRRREARSTARGPPPATARPRGSAAPRSSSSRCGRRRAAGPSASGSLIRASCFALVVDAERRLRDRLEALVGDPPAADRAGAVRAVVDPVRAPRRPRRADARRSPRARRRARA